MPRVMVPLKMPKGLPMASTFWPTWRSELLPRVTGLQVGRLDLNDGEVVRLVGSDDGGRVVLFVGEDDFQLPGAVDDVVVGEDVAFFVDDEAGAGALLGLGAKEEIIGDDGGGDVDHGGNDALVDVHVVLLLAVERRGSLGLGDVNGFAGEPRGGWAGTMAGVEEECGGEQHSENKRS